MAKCSNLKKVKDMREYNIPMPHSEQRRRMCAISNGGWIPSGRVLRSPIPSSIWHTMNTSYLELKLLSAPLVTFSMVLAEAYPGVIVVMRTSLKVS